MNTVNCPLAADEFFEDQGDRCRGEHCADKDASATGSHQPHCIERSCVATRAFDDEVKTDPILLVRDPAFEFRNITCDICAEASQGKFSSGGIWFEACEASGTEFASVSQCGDA